MRRHEICHFVKNEKGEFYNPADVLAVTGAMLQAVVSAPAPLAEAIIRAGGTPPAPVAVRALIDTGCSRTAVHVGVIGKLCLPQTGTGKSYTTSGVSDIALHPVQIYFPELGAGQFLPQAMACNLAGGPCEVLLGTDLLRHCVLIYDGLAGRVTVIN